MAGETDNERGADLLRSHRELSDSKGPGTQDFFLLVPGCFFHLY